MLDVQISCFAKGRSCGRSALSIAHGNAMTVVTLCGQRDLAEAVLHLSLERAFEVAVYVCVCRLLYLDLSLPFTIPAGQRYAKLCSSSYDDSALVFVSRLFVLVGQKDRIRMPPKKFHCHEQPKNNLRQKPPARRAACCRLRCSTALPSMLTIWDTT